LLRELCLSFSGATEQIQWIRFGIQIGGKMFALPRSSLLRFIFSLQGFKPENFAELTERPHIIPAPYLVARMVRAGNQNAVPRDELAGLPRESYELVAAKLPKKFRGSCPNSKPLQSKPSGANQRARKASKRKRRPSR